MAGAGEVALRRMSEAPPEGVEAEESGPGRRAIVFDIAGGTIAKLVVGLLVLGFVSGLLDRMRDIFVWFIAAAFLAVALNPLVEKLEPKIGRQAGGDRRLRRLRDRLHRDRRRPSWRRS